MNARLIAERVFRAGIASVLPDMLIREYVQLSENKMRVAGQEFFLHEINSIYVIGAGKASGLMAREMENILGEKISGGHVVVKYGHVVETNRIRITEAGHPVPDRNSVTAAEEIIKIASRAGEKDLVIFLVSGGGSSLLADCPEGISIDDIIILNRLLVGSGADIKEINAVRKHLSRLKGGQLAQAAYPARMVSLVLSDVVGDPLDSIASGPTVPDPTTFRDALIVLEKYKIREKVPMAVFNYLQKGIEGHHTETPGPEKEFFKNISNVIIGNNQKALEGAAAFAKELGLHPMIITHEMEGDAVSMADYIMETAMRIQQNKKINKPACLLFGGETTLLVDGPGLGGRNQHLALYAATKLKGKNGITLLAGGTDGTDGPTDAAGAIVDCSTIETAEKRSLDTESYLRSFDSYHFFEKAGGHIKTGPTMTNVMDMIVVIVEEKELLL